MREPVISDGLHLLEGFSYYSEDRCFYESCDGVIMRIDGKNYCIYEDPDDGFRSYCDIHITDDPCTNTFPPQKVVIENYLEENELQFTDRGILIYNENKELILKAITECYDDYYPIAHYEWHPENLPINKNKDHESNESF